MAALSADASGTISKRNQRKGSERSLPFFVKVLSFPCPNMEKFSIEHMDM
jgi:hypothetical protein